MYTLPQVSSKLDFYIKQFCNLFLRVNAIENGNTPGNIPTLAAVLENNNITNGFAIQLDDNNETYFNNALGNPQITSDANNGLVLKSAVGNDVFLVNEGQFVRNIDFIEANLTMNASDIKFNSGGLKFNNNDQSAFNSLRSVDVTANHQALLQDKDGTISYLDDINRVVIKTVYSDYSLNSDDEIILVDTSEGDISITLPTAIGRIGTDDKTKTITIKKIASTGAVNILTTGSETVDNTIPPSLTNLSSIVFVSNNIGWYIL